MRFYIEYKVSEIIEIPETIAADLIPLVVEEAIENTTLSLTQDNLEVILEKIERKP